MEGDDSTTRAGSTTKLNVVDGGESHIKQTSARQKRHETQEHTEHEQEEREQQQKEAKEEGKRRKRMKNQVDERE